MISKQKSNLAKLMANENIYVEQRKVPTAHFDLESRTLVIPTFKDNLSETTFLFLDTFTEKISLH